MVGDRNSDMGAGWAVGARLFQVDEYWDRQVIERIKKTMKEMTLGQCDEYVAWHR